MLLLLQKDIVCHFGGCELKRLTSLGKMSTQINLVKFNLFDWQIFTEDLPEVESLPRNKVLGFLIENFKNLAVPYLVRTHAVTCMPCSDNSNLCLTSRSI